jgi:uncharacterized protein YijF (DUF1287 family)
MQRVTDKQFKDVVVSILESCHGSLVQDLSGESKNDIFALQKFTSNYATTNRLLSQIAVKYTDKLYQLKYRSGDPLKMAMVCSNALHEINALRTKNV